MLKPILKKVLKELGFELTDEIKMDYQTVIPPESFDLLDDSLVRHLAKDYNLHHVDDIQSNISSERKFQIVNRVLELYHQTIIDSIKEVDDMPVVGYRLEKMPAGF